MILPTYNSMQLTVVTGCCIPEAGWQTEVLVLAVALIVRIVLFAVQEVIRHLVKVHFEVIFRETGFVVLDRNRTTERFPVQPEHTVR